jgi:hypothetical protein
VILFFRKFPAGRIRMDIRIKQALAAAAVGVGPEASTAVGRITGDAPGEYCHHTHFHAEIAEIEE